MTFSKKSTSWLNWFGLALAMVAALSCGTSDPAPGFQRRGFGKESVGTLGAALTAAQESVLGFEAPTTEWTRTNGSISESTVVTQGSKSLSVNPNGWTELTSIALSSIGPVNGSFKFDLRVPASVPWGQVRGIVIMPSLTLFQDLGGVELSTFTPGQYREVSFSIPAAVVTALNGNYTDLKLRVVLNAPSGLGAFLVDNLRLTNPPTPPTPPSGPTTGVFSVAIPSGETLDRLLFTATQDATIDSRVDLGANGSLTVVGNSGSGGMVFQSGAKSHANMYSPGLVKLASQCRVDGFVKTKVAVQRQDNTVVLPAQNELVVPNVPFETFTWSVDIPAPVGNLDTVGNGQSLSLVPGSYANLNVATGGNVYLHSGVYYFDSFVSNSGSNVHVDVSSGPLVIYVKGTLTYRGPFVRDAGPEGVILFGHLGTGPAILEAPFVGAIVSPNGTVELRRPSTNQHKGQFFGKNVHVFSDLQLLPLAFDFGSLTPPAPGPNADGDPKGDLEDLCILDPDKIEPGICGCGVSDFADRDGDEIPTCIDPCPDDPNNSDVGPCGCLGEDNLQLVGTPCYAEDSSGASPTAGTCNATGQCSAPKTPPVPGNVCEFKSFRGNLYWFCSGNYSWSQVEAFCNAKPHRHLAKVDDRVENRWLSRVAGQSVWIGGNDIAAEGLWHWGSQSTRNARAFWSGDATGETVARRFNSWANGKPGFEDCLALQADASWTDASCSASYGFVCEQPREYRKPFGPIDPRGAYPSIPDDAPLPGEGPTAAREAEDAAKSNPAPPTTTNNNPSKGQGINFTGNNTTSPGPQRLIFRFGVAAGTYRIWLRMIAPNADDDSFYARVDNGTWITGNNYATKTNWTWDLIRNSNSGNAIVQYTLTAGNHTLEIANRESGFMVDKIYVTSLGDTPSGVGPAGGGAPTDPCIANIGFPSPDDPDPESAAMTTKFNDADTQQNSCDTACQSGETPACIAECQGKFTALPAAGEACDYFTAYEKGFCSIETFDPSPTATCTDNSQCSSAYPMCGRLSGCAVLERPEPCNDTSECSNGFVCSDHRCAQACSSTQTCSGGLTCDTAHGVCVDFTKTDRCSDLLAAANPSDPPECVGLCYSVNHCGKPDPFCAVDTGFEDKCEVVEYCHPRAEVAQPEFNTDQNVENSVFDEAVAFPEPDEPTKAFESAKPPNCGGEDEAICQYEIGQHPWCKLALNDYLTDDGQNPDATKVGSDVADDDPQFGDKQGGAGHGEAISFDFDPQLTMDYDVNALPFGDAKFDVHARAGASAGVSFDLFGFYKGRVSVLDAFGELRARRCGFNTDARLALLGIDFLPVLLGDSYEDLDKFDTPEALATECEEAIAEYEKAVNRVKKAMRDAQELSRQYKLLISGGKRFADDLCDQLLMNGMVPDRFFELLLPSRSCEGITPEKTVNLLIAHYRNEVLTLVQQQATMLTVGLANLVPQDPSEVVDLPEVPDGFGGDVPDTLNLPHWSFGIPLLDDVSNITSFSQLDEARKESQQVANFMFALGPVPMNLTVDVFYAYGIAGGLNFDFNPGNLLVAYRSSGVSQPLATASANVTPYAGAGVSLFVGAGFDFGPLAAKIGIQGDVALGLISVPITAGAGVNVTAMDDKRPMPADLSAVAVPGSQLFPPGGRLPQKFVFDAGYKLHAQLDVTDILSGSIAATLKIKFFFFSKTWKATIVTFPGLLPDLHETLLDTQGGLGLELDLGPLGGFQMPLPFVDLQELDENPLPLPPLPDDDDLPGPGEGPSLVHLTATGDDPRYAPFDPARAQQLFYDGFCEPLSCFTPFDFGRDIDEPQEDPADYTENPCTTHEDCCGFGPTVGCWPLVPNAEEAHCETCRSHDEIASVIGEGGNDCCPDLSLFAHPDLSGYGYVCSEACRREGDGCWEDGGDYFPCCGDLVCDNGTCTEPPPAPTCNGTGAACGGPNDLPCCGGCYGGTCATIQ